jgi:hypothetical protein
MYATPSCKDFGYLRDFALYLNNSGGAAAPEYSHAPATVWYWWCWNANSGDTGGIVAQASSRVGSVLSPHTSDAAKLTMR